MPAQIVIGLYTQSLYWLLSLCYLYPRSCRGNSIKDPAFMGSIAEWNAFPFGSAALMAQTYDSRRGKQGGCFCEWKLGLCYRVKADMCLCMTVSSGDSTANFLSFIRLQFVAMQLSKHFKFRNRLDCEWVPKLCCASPWQTWGVFLTLGSMLFMWHHLRRIIISGL